MSTYMGLTNFQKQSSFLAHPVLTLTYLHIVVLSASCKSICTICKKTLHDLARLGLGLL